MKIVKRRHCNSAHLTVISNGLIGLNTTEICTFLSANAITVSIHSRAVATSFSENVKVMIMLAPILFCSFVKFHTLQFGQC